MYPRLIAVALLAMVTVACGQRASAPEPVPAPVPAPAPAALPPAGAGPTGEFGPTERAFVELTIATDEAAVALLELGARRGSDQALRDLATELIAARRAELTELHRLLVDAAVPYVNHHAGHDMPGMPTAEELAALTVAGPGFDAQFARLVRAHLEESAQVVRGALGSVTHKETRALVQRMAQERAGSLARLGAS